MGSHRQAEEHHNAKCVRNGIRLPRLKSLTEGHALILVGAIPSYGRVSTLNNVVLWIHHKHEVRNAAIDRSKIEIICFLVRQPPPLSADIPRSGQDISVIRIKHDRNQTDVQDENADLSKKQPPRHAAPQETHRRGWLLLLLLCVPFNSVAPTRPRKFEGWVNLKDLAHRHPPQLVYLSNERGSETVKKDIRSIVAVQDDAHGLHCSGIHNAHFR
mmetsp:Transcript_64463/g.170712  ORF Transcript_64463/g.170712 Transcript_64463/m.170712 type:complete len:215 (-) Transcript_64463:584-1228(-)